MKPNHPYTITFPIWQCDQWCALKGRLKLTDEQIVVSRWTDITYLDEELALLDSYHRIKPQAETKLVKPQVVLLPSILQIVRTNTYTDVLIENVSQWLQINGDLSKLLLIYFGYDLYNNCYPRDCTIENIIKNGDSIVILDFGLKKRTEKYCVYWNPLILKGKPLRSSYQWSLGIIYLVMTQGQYILNEVQKHIQDWLQGGRLDIANLITNKKPSVQNLIASLLNPENPIPWQQIPFHPAFREDNNCKNILKEFQIRYNRTELKQRSASRLSSRDDSNSNQISIVPQPYGSKNVKVSEQNLLNQSLITKVSNMYKIHQDKIRSAVSFGNRYQSGTRQNSSSMQSRQTNQSTTSKFNNFFSSQKLIPKLQNTTQNISNTALKTIRNQTQNTTNFSGQESYRKSVEVSQEKNQYIKPPTHQKSDFFYDKIRARISSVKGNSARLEQKIRNGSSHNCKADKQTKQEIIYSKSSKTQDEVEQLYQQSENAIEKYKEIYSSDLEIKQQQLPQPQPQPQIQQQPQTQPQPQSLNESRISNAENYIQLIKRASNCLTIFSQKYNRALDAINIIGQTVAKCLTFFNGLQNFWVIPLFLVFKRMLQLRLQIEQLLEKKVNSYEISDWDEISTSVEYENYLNKVKKDNQLVQNELKLLLSTAKAKAEKLDKSRKDKVEWFLNDNVNDNIKDVCYTYFHGQIYKNIRDKKGIQKPLIDWLILQVQAQASLIICELPILKIDKENFTYDGYLKAVEMTDELEIQQYLKKNDQYLEHK